MLTAAVIAIVFTAPVGALLMDLTYKKLLEPPVFAKIDDKCDLSQDTDTVSRPENAACPADNCVLRLAIRYKPPIHAKARLQPPEIATASRLTSEENISIISQQKRTLLRP